MAVGDASIMTRLKEETAAEHKLAESSHFEKALVSGRLPRPAFVEYLAQRLPIHAALERGVGELAARNRQVAGVVTPDLLQEPNLRADLAFFGVNADAVAPREASRRLIDEFEQLRASRPMALLGPYYVLEGSKNGARFIARAVMPAYRLSPGQGTRYLDPHGEQQRPLWQAFRERMDALPLAAGEADAIVEAAKGMFRGIRDLDQEIWTALCEPESAVA